MKEELRLLAAKAGFRQHLDYYDYYHWLCDLQKWLREEHRISVEVYWGNVNGPSYAWHCRIFYIIEDYKSYLSIPQKPFNTYEQALEAGLKKALEKL